MSRTGQLAAVPAERVIARLRPHARRLFWPSIVLIAACAALGYWGVSLPEAWQRVAVLAAACLVGVLLFLLPLLSWLSSRYTVTTRRVALRRGVFVRTRQQILHHRGHDVTVTQTWLQRAFRCGTIRIHRGDHAPVVLRDVPQVDLVQSALLDLMESSGNLVAQVPTTGIPLQ